MIAARVLPNFSLQNEADRAVRTTLLERRGDSAIVLVATARSLDGHGSVLASRDVPEFVRAATPGHATFGVGVGLSGTRTIHAAVSPPLLPWVIVREHDVADVERMLSLPLAINEIVLVLFYALAVLAVRHRLRAGRQRRDAELVRVRSDFVSSISHELRTPLTQIRMYAEMLNTGLLPHPAESNRALQVIEKESARLSVLVDKVLNLTRVRQASAGSEPPATDLADVIGRVAASVNVLAADRGTTLVVRVPTRMLARIDAEALHQVLLNLLDNALKYGPRGQTVHLSAQPVGGVVRLLVEDEGPGVPAAEREMIWDRFRRGSLAERGQEIGSGIGLAIVRELVVQSGGRVFVEDRTPKPGARFVVELPGTND